MEEVEEVVVQLKWGANPESCGVVNLPKYMSMNSAHVIILIQGGLPHKKYVGLVPFQAIRLASLVNVYELYRNDQRKRGATCV